MDKISKTSFGFSESPNGGYIVRYTTPKKNDYWIAEVDDISLISKVFLAKEPNQFDLQSLRWHMRRHGKHYDHKGRPIKPKKCSKFRNINIKNWEFI